MIQRFTSDTRYNGSRRIFLWRECKSDCIDKLSKFFRKIAKTDAYLAAFNKQFTIRLCSNLILARLLRSAGQ